MKKFIVILWIAILSACAMPPVTDGSSVAPNQAAINATYASYDALDQAILAANKAVVAGVLKGADADKTLAAFRMTKAGLDAALVALQAANVKVTK